MKEKLNEGAYTEGEKLYVKLQDEFSMRIDELSNGNSQRCKQLSGFYIGNIKYQQRKH